MKNGAQLHFFGGKGGAGKTTLAAAFALSVAEKSPQSSVLLVSFRPDRGLSDLLKKKLTAKPARVVPGKSKGGLFAIELEGADHIGEMLPGLAEALQGAGSAGAVLGRDDVGSLLSRAADHLAELAGLLWISERIDPEADRHFDTVVVDLPATAHALRLLDVPGKLRAALALAKSERPGKKREAARHEDGSELDSVLERLDALEVLLRDPERTELHLVASAEPVPEAQARGFFARLSERKIPVKDIWIDGVEAAEGCPACFGRRGLQAPHVRKLSGLDKSVPMVLVGLREAAPKGLDGLRQLAKEAFSGKETKALEFSPSEGPPALVRAPSMAPIAAPQITPTRLIFFVGQGGVGKSSCAAAAAVTLTEKEGPVLLISIDPAHSLSDVLQSRLTDVESQVKGTKGLYARELDISGWWTGFRKRLREKSEKAFAKVGKESFPDREVLRNLLDLAPAGLEDLPAMAVLTYAITQERFKRIVVDSAPSEAGPRILELPAVGKAWLSAVSAVLAKYESKGLGELRAELSGLLRQLERFEKALSSPAEARFVVVTRGEELAVPRTERLVSALRARKLAVERVLVNRVLPKSTCDKCENRRKGHLAAAKILEKKIGLQVTMAPALGRHPGGLRELKAFRTAWYALSAPAKVKAA